MYVCMCVYVCVCMYVCMYVCRCEVRTHFLLATTFPTHFTFLAPTTPGTAIGHRYLAGCRTRVHPKRSGFRSSVLQLANGPQHVQLQPKTPCSPTLRYRQCRRWRQTSRDTDSRRWQPRTCVSTRRARCNRKMKGSSRLAESFMRHACAPCPRE